MVDGMPAPDMCCESLMCASDGAGAFSCVVADTLYHLIPGNDVGIEDCGIPDYVADRTGVDPFNNGGYCGFYMSTPFTAIAYSADNEAVCNSLYVDLNDINGPVHLARCDYTETSPGLYRCVSQQLNLACE
eukprot:scaffold3795_cov126-Isochrysis_galbana.AAC.23